MYTDKVKWDIDSLKKIYGPVIMTKRGSQEHLIKSIIYTLIAGCLFILTITITPLADQIEAANSLSFARENPKTFAWVLVAVLSTIIVAGLTLVFLNDIILSLTTRVTVFKEAVLYRQFGIKAVNVLIPAQDIRFMCIEDTGVITRPEDGTLSLLVDGINEPLMLPYIEDAIEVQQAITNEILENKENEQ